MSETCNIFISNAFFADKDKGLLAQFAIQAEKINTTVSKFNPSLLMETSLDGYYVFYADALRATTAICNPAMIFESGYQLLLDSKGGHRLRATSLKLLHRETSK